MWRNALFATGMTLMLIGLGLSYELDFLKYYKWVLLDRWPYIATYTLLLSINLFALFVWVTRKLFLKDVGKKREVFEQQVRM